MEEKKWSMPILHIYGQHHERDSAFLIGNEAGLRALYRTSGFILSSASSFSRRKVNLFVNDGEGFTLCVQLISEEDKLRKFAVPYISESARETKEDAINPYGIVDHNEGEV